MINVMLYIVSKYNFRPLYMFCRLVAYNIHICRSVILDHPSCLTIVLDRVQLKSPVSFIFDYIHNGTFAITIILKVHHAVFNILKSQWIYYKFVSEKAIRQMNIHNVKQVIWSN